MTTRIADVSLREAARIAGVGYLIIFVLAIFANFLVRANLIEEGDAAATVANIVQSEALFRAGLISFLVVFVVDVVIAWALYIFFRIVSRDVSLVAAWFRLVYAVFLGVALIFFFQVLQLVSGADHLTAFQQGQLDSQVMLSLDAFNYTWLIGLVCFGIHLGLLGYLILKSVSIPRLLGFILVLAGAAYVLDTLANALLANYEDYQNVFLAIVAIPSVIGELWLGLWLLIRGGKGGEAPHHAG